MLSLALLVAGGIFAPLEAQISFRASAQAVTTSTSITVDKPTGTVQNDVMVATIFTRSDSDEGAITQTGPAGWTLVRRTAQGGNDAIEMETWRKVAGASEPANYAWGFVQSAGGGAIGIIQAYSGVDTATPVDVEGGQLNASSTSVTAPSITTTVANTMLVGSFGIRSLSTFTPPTGMTERVDAAQTSAGLEGTDELFAGAGATGTRVATGTVAGANIAHILALRPASGSDTTPPDDVTNLTTGTVRSTSLQLSWTAPGVIKV